MGKLSRAERNIAWCERFLYVPEGKFVGQPIVLPDYMRDDFRAIYDNEAVTRRAIISRGRKNAKTTESAMITLLHLCGPEARRNAQLYSTALSRDQAAILFALASKMVLMSPELKRYVRIRDTAKQLLCEELGTVYRALSADATTAYGLSPSLVIHDELGQVKGPRSSLYEAMETATAAQEDPLSIIISTQAPTDADLLSVLIDDALKGEDPRTVLRFQHAKDGVEPFSEEAIKQANPAYGLFMNSAEVLDMAAGAKRMPSRQAEFENLVLNRRVEMNNPFIAASVWKENGEPVATYTGRRAWLGLDLSETSDLTALVIIVEAEDGKFDVYPIFWLPAEGLEDKARNDRVHYDVWHRDGFLETTPGRSIKYEYIAHRLKDVFEEYDVQGAAFDRWNWRHFKPWLEKVGFAEADLEKFKEFGQGFASMSPALRTLESLMLDNKFRHGMHPVLTMCAANAVVQSDPSGNRKLSKSKSRGRIDGMVALAMASSIAADGIIDDIGDADGFFANPVVV